MISCIYNSPSGGGRMKKRQQIRSISVSKEVKYLEDLYDDALVALTTVTQVNWGASKRNPATLYKDGLRVAIKEINELTESIKKDLKNVK